MKTDKKSEKGGFKYLLSRKADRVTKRIKLTEEDFARVSTSNPLKFTTFPQTKAIRVPATRICPGTLVPKENPTYCEYIWKFNETKTDERAPEECPTCGSTLTKRAEKAEYITGKNWVIQATKPWVAKTLYTKGIPTIYDKSPEHHGALWMDVLNDEYSVYTRGGRRIHPVIKEDSATPLRTRLEA